MITAVMVTVGYKVVSAVEWLFEAFFLKRLRRENRRMVLGPLWGNVDIF